MFDQLVSGLMNLNQIKRNLCTEQFHKSAQWVQHNISCIFPALKRKLLEIKNVFTVYSKWESVNVRPNKIDSLKIWLLPENTEFSFSTGVKVIITITIIQVNIDIMIVWR